MARAALMSVFEKFRHPPHAQPADHGRRDFVADEVAENRGVALVSRDSLANGLAIPSRRMEFSSRNATCSAQGIEMSVEHVELMR